uniref:Uncharacterized protein n=1 Tax=Oncorhynchus kisutch TaxID=8019 RepID=A0A8C7DMY5_ONCKI
MTDVEPVVTDFAATGRTGRRNAVPDITGAGPADLSDKLAELSVALPAQYPSPLSSVLSGQPAFH